MNKDRYLMNHIANDLTEKMGFLCGPGKLAKCKPCPISVLHAMRASNISIGIIGITARTSWAVQRTAGLHIFDELHKYNQWKNHIKGIFDTKPDNFHILVTGSARLDVYHRGGDSLMGRYHSYRLHPFSVAEALEATNHIEPGQQLHVSPSTAARTAFEQLMTFGGFPEPFIRNDARTLRRWHNQRIERLRPG